MMSSELTPGKKLSELRVIDLKQELDKRGLEKTGVKASLLDRLKKALENEGQDPEQYVFELISSKRSKGDDSLLEEQEEHTDDKKSDGVLEDLDLDDVDCELEDDGIDIGDFVDTDVDNLKQELEPAKNEAKSESSREEQKPEIAAMDTDAVKKEAKSETPVITVDAVDSNDVVEKGPTKTESAEKTKQETNKENLLNYMDLAPPTPTSMPVVAPFTSEDTINMDTSGDRKEDDISLIVHVDESQNEFDMPETPSKASDNDSIQGSASVDLDRGKIEEKAAADAEKAFTNGETTGDDSAKSTSKPATECSQPSGVDKINGGEKMDTETTQDKPQNETTVAGNDGKETSAAGSDPKAATKKPDAKSKSSVNSRNLWISGLSTSTRATDLKALFSKYGKVAGAKVVTNARSPGSRCYGFVSMNTAEEASKCIQYLHRTELHGRMISVERAKTDPSQAKAITVPKKSPGKPTESKEEEPKKDSEKKEPEKEGEKKEGEKDKKVVEKKEGDKKDEKKTPEARRHSGGDHRHGNSRSYRRRSQGHSRHHSSKDKSKERDAKKEEPKKKDDGPEKAKAGGAEKKEVEVCVKGKPEEKKTEEKSVEKKGEEKKEEKKKSKEKEMLSLEKIKEERERERLRQRERRLREEERRRRELAERERIRERNRQREVMARQREESVRLQREREWIKVERERLEREKLEAEREKLRLERERRERERQELAEQRRVEALRYEERQRAMKRPYDNRGNDDYWGEPKRATYEQRDRGGYTDYDARPANSGEQRDRGYQQDRPADRYDRNAARPVERDQRTYDRRDDPAQRSGHARGGADKREVGRRDQPQSRDRDDRNRQPEDRYNKYESERDTRRDVPVRDHDRRDQRRGASPHRPAPRDSPSNRRNDAGSSGYRGAADDRQSRDRGHENRAASDRSYSGHTATQRGSEPNAWTTAPVVGTRDAKDTRSYPRGAVSVASNGPGTSGIIGTGAGTWAAPDRRPAGHVVVPQAADPRAWQAVTSMPQRTVVNAPMLQPAPTTNAFLASAANIMMGVGLARGGDNRYDAYKTLPTTIRRY